MAFTAVSASAEMVASNVQQIIDALSGTAGSGQPIILTKLSDSSTYALDVANADSTNSYGLRVQDSAGNNLLLVYKNNVTIGASAANDTLTINANISGKVYIGDSANANMTAGLTINQGANDDEILAGKSSDIAHGITSHAETDTYFTISKQTAATGGVLLAGYSENIIGVAFTSRTASESTAKNTSAGAGIYMGAALKSGTSTTTCSADANLVAITNNGTTRFIFDAEGSGHADVEWTTYDKHDDLALAREMEAELLAREDGARTDRRHALEQAGIIGKDSWHMENDRPRAMVNFTRLAMLHHGALLQSGQRMAVLEAQNAALHADLADMRRKLLPC